MRGMNSQILGKKLAEDMTKRGPKPRLVEFKGVGHAPTLIQLAPAKNTRKVFRTKLKRFL